MVLVMALGCARVQPYPRSCALTPATLAAYARQYGTPSADARRALGLQVPQGAGVYEERFGAGDDSVRVVLLDAGDDGIFDRPGDALYVVIAPPTGASATLTYNGDRLQGARVTDRNGKRTTMNGGQAAPFADAVLCRLQKVRAPRRTGHPYLNIAPGPKP